MRSASCQPCSHHIPTTHTLGCYAYRRCGTGPPQFPTSAPPPPTSFPGTLTARRHEIDGGGAAGGDAIGSMHCSVRLPSRMLDSCYEYSTGRCSVAAAGSPADGSMASQSNPPWMSHSSAYSVHLLEASALLNGNQSQAEAMPEAQVRFARSAASGRGRSHISGRSQVRSAACSLDQEDSSCSVSNRARRPSVAETAHRSPTSLVSQANRVFSRVLFSSGGGTSRK